METWPAYHANQDDLKKMVILDIIIIKTMQHGGKGV